MQEDENIKLNLAYNTQLSKLIMPEYGRSIQAMVNHCLTIEDREERKRCANGIINIMGNLFPHLRDTDDFKHKLWDHLAIMSEFKLDIDYPCEIIKEENLHTSPERVNYKMNPIRYRHYGKVVEELIVKAQDMEEGEERSALIGMLANQMKKSFLMWNKETVDNEKIFADLREYSHGKINLTAQDIRLIDSKEILNNNSGANNNPGNRKQKNRKRN